MPLESDIIRYSTTLANSSTSERRYCDAGFTVREVLEDELCVNPDKFTVMVNGAPCTDLSREVEEGDSIALKPKGYNSGMSI